MFAKVAVRHRRAAARTDNGDSGVTPGALQIRAKIKDEAGKRKKKEEILKPWVVLEQEQERNSCRPVVFLHICMV